MRKKVAKTHEEVNERDVEVEMHSIRLPDIKRHRVAFRISGDKLLVSRFEEKAVTEMLCKHMQIPTEKLKKDPNGDFERRKILNVKGQDVVPVLGIKAAMVNTSVFTGKGKDKLPKTVLRGSLYICGEGAPLKYASVENNLGIVRNANGNPDVRFRPLYREWSCEFVVDFMPRMISLDQVLYLLKASGESIGLCEWRPEKNGNHGLFEVEVLNDKEISRILKACATPLKPLELPSWLVKMLETEGSTPEELIAEAKQTAKAEREKRVAK